MKRLMSSLCTLLIVGGLSAAAQGATDNERFLFVECELTIEGEGSRGGIVANLYLLKFDTATGQTWRYERRHWNDLTKRMSCFVRIPLEGMVGDGEEPGRFKLIVRSGGKATQPFPDVLILDGTTGMVWIYRGISRNKDGVSIVEESFVLVKDTEP